MKGVIVKQTRSLLGFSITTATIDLICEGVRHALEYERAAVLSGISIWQARKLRKDATDLATGSPKAAEFDETYKALLEYLISKLTIAQAEGERELLDIMRTAAIGDWKAADRLLQIMRPERYSKRSIVVTSDPIPTQGAKPINFEELSEADLQQYIDAELMPDEVFEQPVEPVINTDEEINNSDELSNS